MIRHTVIDVEAVLDPSVPEKEGIAKDGERRFDPPVRWKVVSIGCFSFVDYEPENFGCIRVPTEQEMIGLYIEHLEKERPCVVTWNGRWFDHPVLGFRALRYGIPMPWWYGSQRGPRYRYGDKALDVKDALADFGASATASQNQVARLIGWPGKGEVSGEDVAALYAEGNIETIHRYCLGDVANLAGVWLRYELLRGNLTRREWPRFATRLLDFLAREPPVMDLIAKVDRAIYVGAPARQLTLTK